MSAIILQFPTKAVHVAVATACIDILPVDKRGFVILDACVPGDLASGFLRLFRDRDERDVTPVPNGVEAYPELEFHFSLLQGNAHGFVAIEACIPLAMATAFREMATPDQKTAA
jgi:hypothetical protein